MHIGTAVRYAVFMRSESVFITCPRQWAAHGFSIVFGPRRALCSVLARERPDHNQEVRLVAQGSKPAAPRPALEVRLDAGAVAPGCSLDAIPREAAFGQEVLHAQLGPARAVDGSGVLPDHEGRGDEDIAAQRQYVVYLARGAVRPQQVLLCICP